MSDGAEHDPNQRPAGDGISLRRMWSDDPGEARLGADQTDPSATGTDPTPVPGVRLCSKDGCSREVYSRGFCARCYKVEHRAASRLNASPLLVEARAAFSEQSAARARQLGLTNLARAMEQRAERMRNEERIRAEAEAMRAREEEARAQEERRLAAYRIRRERQEQARAEREAILAALRKEREDRKLAEEEADRQKRLARRARAAERIARDQARKDRRAEKIAERQRAQAARGDRQVLGMQRAYEERLDAREAARAEDDRELLLALYDHPATGRLIRMVNAGRWEPEVHLGAWLEAAQEIPPELRQFALAIRSEFDPLYRIALKIAALGGDTLHNVGRLYGLSRERVRQVEVDGLRELANRKEVRSLRDHLDDGIENWQSMNREAAA